MAIVAGSNLILGPEMFVYESKLNMLSPHGRSRMWDASADGYARGEGSAAVILKPLSQALRDGDYIDCVIRETGVNQDGRTKGITMPSATAQAALIRDTYARAGLDPRKKADRCQYFEAHGTGTPAGDPIEAKAVHSAFFPSDTEDDILYVGSIKTVIGHLEGCAGLAGLLKVSLALQHAIIPSNMHFERLNAEIVPYSQQLRVPLEAHTWPFSLYGSVRRASVNSFGFGGTNAHVIVESFHSQIDRVNGFATIAKSENVDKSNVSLASMGPLTFSALSQTSLVKNIEVISKLLKQTPTIDYNSLAWTFQSRRSQFPSRAAFAASTIDEMVSKLDNAVQASTQSTDASNGIQQQHDESARLLGIFTGQGAQWASMGRELILSSHVVRESIEKLEQTLAALPDCPSWSLRAELMVDQRSSRLAQAAIAQPLCTAIQIALIDLLRYVGVHFDAVVGHSSGEIAAAYASGIFSAGDAVKIAYYRGKYASLARGPSGQSGAMMAVGISFEEASRFCEQLCFTGRIVVAASNAPSSVTLSGDEDAIQEAKALFDEKKTFARLLKVDTAYHSHHMEACAGEYLQALRACHIRVQHSRQNCDWFSSVQILQGGQAPAGITDVYWVNNMVNPVLFSQAVQNALSHRGHFDMCLEIGPHPALKGPTTQTIKQIAKIAPPYSGCLCRAEHDVEAFARSIGDIWARLGPTSVDFDGYRSAFLTTSERKPQLLVGLPSYSWDHEKTFWRESRISKKFRSYAERHSLIGTRYADDTEDYLRWRNLIRLTENPWLQGHKFQSQVLFPAAGYVAMVLEASRTLCSNLAVSSIELRDIEFSRAMSIGDDPLGVETLFTLKVVESSHADDDDIVVADATFYSCASGKPEAWEKNFNAQLRLQFGHEATPEIPDRVPARGSLMPVDLDHFYSSCSDIGLDYSGLFRALTSIHRRLNLARATMAKSAGHDDDRRTIIHPGLLDCAFQTLFAAFAAPKDGGLWSAFLPTSIDRLRVNTALIERLHTVSEYHVDAFVTDRPSTEIVGDIDISTSDLEHVWIQVEGLRCSALTKPQPSNDKELFACEVWNVSALSQSNMLNDSKCDSQDELDIVELADRLSYHYLLKLAENVPRENLEKLDVHFQRLFEFMDHLFQLVRNGQHPTVRKEWECDSTETLRAMTTATLAKFPGQIDLEIITALGRNYPAIVQNRASHLDVLMENDMLTRLYQEGLGSPRGNSCLARIAAQIGHQYPHMKILEIGAGTGGTSKAVLETVGDSFQSYTYTDISPGFFRKAQEAFKAHAGKMQFSVLDIEKDIAAQGYVDQSFDLIIASNVLHATKSLAETMRNTRRLLKPGGYLLLFELTNQILRYSFMMGGLPGWWLGADDDRRLCPTISPDRWDSLLRNSGFSGVDRIVHDMNDPSRRASSVIVTQAVDDRVSLLRQPSTSSQHLLPNSTFLLIGGRTCPTQALVDTTARLLHSNGTFAPQTIRLTTIEEVDANSALPAAAVLVAADLDEPIFKDLTSAKHGGIQNLFGQAKQILWLTNGSRARNPYHNMSVALGRSLVHEFPHVRIQFLDLDGEERFISHAQTVAEMLLRLVMLDLPGFSDNLLWSSEQELAIEEGGVLIPRAIPHAYLNDRLNSARRLITMNVSSIASPIEVSSSGGYLEAREAQHASQPGPGHIRIQTRCSTLSAVKIIGNSFFHVCIGTVIDVGASLDFFEVGQTVFALVPTNASIADVPAEQVLADPAFDAQENTRLFNILGNLVAQSLLCSVPPGSTMLLHQPNELIASVVVRRGIERGVRVICTTSTLPAKDGCVYIHPSESKRVIRSLIPATIHLFIDFCDVDSDSLGSRIGNCLPSSCDTWRKDSILRNISRRASSDSTADLRDILILACSFTQLDFSGRVRPYEIPAGRIGSAGGPVSSQCIVDWRGTDSVPVRIQPIDATDLFFKDKTYLLVGFAGGLGRSICRWMVNHGAKYLVLTSRNPYKVETGWLKELATLGAIVKIIEADVSDKNDLKRVYEETKVDTPPVGGVANAAMVLEDSMFVDMSFESMKKVVRPKLDISRNLDELFAQNTLDFFLMFSSLTYVCGKFGQSNYAAANGYMVALAAQRRSKGLAASVVDIGIVLGLGYVEETGRGYDRSLWKDNFGAISEPEVHQMIAAAILSGKAGSEHPSEIIAGLQRTKVGPGMSSPPGWTTNPKLSHYVDLQVSPLEQSGGPATLTSSVPIKQQLASATNSEESARVLQECLSMTLGSMLQAAPETFNGNKSLVEIGVDSLIAVEIRTWFMKELNVDMDILKVLGGASAADLCTDALTKLTSGHAPMPDGKSEPGHVSMNGGVGVPNNTTASQDEMSLKRTETLTSSDDDGRAQDRGFPLATPTSITEADVISRSLDISGRIERVGPISYAQSRIYFLSLFLEDQTSFNVTFCNEIRGSLRVSDFARAFREVAQHHEALRTCFFLDDETSDPMQGILTAPTFQLEHRQISDKREVRQEIDLFKRHRYDLEAGQTVKATLLSTGPYSHVLIFGHHHIVLDGVSGQILLRDLDRSYRSQSLAPAYQYSKFSSRQRDLVASGLVEEIFFWRSEFETLPPTSPLLPPCKVCLREEMTNYRASELKFTLDADMTSRIKKASSQLKATAFQIHLSVLQLLIFRLVGGDDLCIGVIDANRSNDLMESLGFFVNLLPMRFKIDEEGSFEHLVTNTRRKVFEALKHSQLPFDILLSELGVPRSPAHSPLFQIAMNYRMGTFRKASIGDCEMKLLSMDDARTAYDLTIDVEDNEDGLCYISFVGQEYLYSVEDLRTLAGQYVQLLNTVSQDASLRLSDYSISHRGENGIRGPVKTLMPEPPLHVLPPYQKAVVTTQTGKLELATKIPIPELEPDSVLVKVAVVALNPADWKLPEFSAHPGAIGGLDFCGTVAAVSSNSLQKPLAVGDRVCGWVFGSNPAEPGNGAFAEYVAAFSDLVMKVPSWMPSEDASTIALGAATAGQALYQSLQLPLPTEPARSSFYVLVYGGSTATGTMAIQLLRL
jgi:hybrid polyketide synthase / nonribosomal peptide synthetase ACE1